MITLIEYIFSLFCFYFYSHIYLYIPIVDVIVFTERLWNSFDSKAPLTMGAYMIGSAVVLNYLREPHGRYSSGEQEIEGNYRHSVARLNSHAEQVGKK